MTGFLDFSTPSGFWDPLRWIIVMIIALLISYYIWKRGNPKHKKGEQIKPFFSGYDAPSPEDAHIRAGNIYWGFITALKRYYAFVKSIHTGNINDYIGWYVGIMALMLIVFLLWGGA